MAAYDFSKYKALYTDVKAQNDLIDARIIDLKDNYTLNETTTSYIEKDIDSIKYTSVPLFYIYYICIILLSGVLFIYKPLNFVSLLIIVILLLLSPLYLIQLELFMYNILVYIYSLLSGLVYKPV
jgi:hypothetical protein